MGCKYWLWHYQISTLLPVVGSSVFFVFLLLSPAIAAVVKEDNSSLSVETGIPLYLFHDSSYRKPLAICVAVHGSAQQAGSMSALATSLATIGYYVVAPDIRGHGRWQISNQSQPSGYEALTQSTHDLEYILKLIQRDYPKSSIVCIGESIGVGIVLAAVARSPKHVKGLILCSAGVQPHLHNPFNLGPDFVMGMARLVQPVDIRKFLSMYCSDDDRVKNEMVNDPLGRNSQTGLELLETFNFLSNEPNLALNIPANVRALVIQGDADQILEPKSAYQIFEALKTKKKTFMMIPGAGHVLLGTMFIKPNVLESIEDWLSRNVLN